VIVYHNVDLIGVIFLVIRCFLHLFSLNIKPDTHDLCSKILGHDLEPRFRVIAYFHISYWSKSKTFFAYVLKKDVLLLCALLMRKILEILSSKVVLIWKQCSCDIIIQTVYYKIINSRNIYMLSMLLYII
jgi:hypothetical protein